MRESAAIAAALIHGVGRAPLRDAPFPHWLPRSLLPEDVLQEIDALPVAPPAIRDTLGKRETHNSTRYFFGPEAMRTHDVCHELASALQSPEVVDVLRTVTGAPVFGGHLRIEYCLDSDGFWLEPHTDIGAKLFTMLIYLSREAGSETWGTDIYDADFNLVTTAPYRRNDGLIFVPGGDSWHGFHKRPISGLRRSLIVNYVTSEWRGRHELAFPDRLAGS